METKANKDNIVNICKKVILIARNYHYQMLLNNVLSSRITVENT